MSEKLSLKSRTYRIVMIMPCRLSNAPSTVIRAIPQMLCQFLGRLVVIYFDDILIFNYIQKEHLFHFKRVLETLRKEKLFVNLKKYTILSSFIHFIGFIVSKDRIAADFEKVKVIRERPTARTIYEARSFHGLATFYRRFEITTIITQIIDCLKKGEFQ